MDNSVYEFDFSNLSNISALKNQLKTFTKAKIYLVSPEYYSQLEKLEKIPDYFSFDGFASIEIRSYHWLPFELKYDACDIETKCEIKIASGEMIHCFSLIDAAPNSNWELNTGEPITSYKINFQYNDKIK